jgi:hypothetical protein
MNAISRLLLSFVLIALCSLTASAQRQTKLYIDDGNGHFTVLKGAGVDTVTFPTTSGTLLASGGNIVVSTEVDSAIAGNMVTVSGKTASATIVNKASSGLVTVSVTAGVSGQLLYLFNHLGNTQFVTLSSYQIDDGKFGIFIYLAGAWRALAIPSVI